MPITSAFTVLPGLDLFRVAFLCSLDGLMPEPESPTNRPIRSKNLNDASPPAHEVENQRNYCQDEKDVNQPARNVKDAETEQPPSQD